MARRTRFLVAIALGLALAHPVRADEEQDDSAGEGKGLKAEVKKGFKEAAHGVAQGAKKVGHAVKEGAKEGWQATKHGAKKVGQGTREGAHKVGEGTKEAGHKAKSAVKGDKKEAEPPQD